MLGFINNKKGFSVSRNGTTDIAYLLDTVDTTSGKKLYVRSFRRASGTTYDIANQVTVELIIPYRLQINDQDKIGKACSGRDASYVPIFNPGLSVSGDTVVGYQGTNYEVNFTRNQLAFINETWPTSVISWQATDAGINLGYVSVSNKKFITVDDHAASMIVKNKDATTDYLIISVCSSINLNFNIWPDYSKRVVKSESVIKDRNAIYSLPTILVYEVPRTNIVACTVTATLKSWTFGLVSDISWFTYQLYKLNDGVTDSPTTYLPNYNFFPTVQVSSAIYPIDVSCIQDIVMDGNDLYLIGEYGGHRTIPGSNATSSNKYIIKQFVAKVTNIIGKSNFYCISSTDLLWARVDTSSFSDLNSGKRVFDVARNMSIDFNTNILGVTFSKYSTPYIMFINVTDRSYAIKEINDARLATIDSYSSGFVIGFENVGSYRFQYTGDVSNLITRLFNSGDKFVNSMDNLIAFGSFSSLGQLVIPSDPMSFIYMKDLAAAGYYFKDWQCVSKLRDTDSIRMGTQNTLGRGFTTKPISFAAYNYRNTDIFLTQFGGPESYVIRSSSNLKLLNVGGKVAADNNDGLPTTSQCYMFYDSNGISAIKNIETGSIVIGSSGQFRYDLGSEQTDDGVNVVFQINNCSGIYRTASDTTGWESIGGGEVGCPVDYTYVRNDFTFEYGGNYTTFIAVAGVSGYWARLKDPLVDISITRASTGTSLLASNDGLRYIEYNTTGACRIHIPVKLNILSETDLTGKHYPDNGFSLNDVDVTIKIKAPIPITKRFTNIVFRPPSSSITITSASTKIANRYLDYSITKTNSNSRLVNLSINQKTAADSSTAPVALSSIQSYVNSYDTLAANTQRVYPQKCSKGDYFYLSWVENINSRAITSLNNGSKSCVWDHRYLISNPLIYLNNVDETDDIYNSSTPYIYLDPGGATVPVKINFSMNHEEFDTSSFSAGLSDNDRYPTISEISLVVTPSKSWPAATVRYNKWAPLINIYKKDPPNGAPVTYPNNTDAFGTNVLSTAGAFISTSGYVSTTSLSGTNIITNVTVGGQYQIFLVVKDEFSQYSVFNITSKNRQNNTKTYRTEFTG